MRTKTFFATYLLFLFLLFSSVGTVSVYLTNSQLNILKEQCAVQFQSIAHSLVRDIDGMVSRNIFLSEPDFTAAVNDILRGYARYYGRQNIQLGIRHMNASAYTNMRSVSEVTLETGDGGYFIRINGVISNVYRHFMLEYSIDISEHIANMRSIQTLLLLSAAMFSVIAAFALYFILSSIFKPLGIVADASVKIADGQFGERIVIKGKNELARVAEDFNKMAEKIEAQIIYLEEEAVNKQQFVDNFAHEIRTPLTSIYGYAEYMQKAQLSETEIIESAEFIISEAGHMRNIANSLLELATLRHYTPVQTEIPISKLFDDVSQTMEKQLQRNGVRIITDIETAYVCGQEDLLKSLLLNLCANAIKSYKSTGGGDKTITLSAKQVNGRLSICVSDNGCGIPADSLHKITEPFYRVDKSRSRSDGGTGLGLTLCKQIAQVHGADMAIRSAVGTGTVVEIHFKKDGIYENRKNP
jgi:signal transduction histidine kinase